MSDEQGLEMNRNLSKGWRWLTFLLVAFLASTAHAQSPQPAENPNLELVGSGVVHAVARQPDGGVVVAGFFASVMGVPRSNIARFKADGTLDLDWHPVVYGVVYALAVDASGDVFLGGTFLRVNGAERAFIAKLSATTGEVDPAWNPGANQVVGTLAIDSKGRVVAGGRFRVIGGVDRKYLARLDAEGAGLVDTSWDPSPNGGVEAIAVDNSGSVFVGGQFSIIAEQQRRGLAKFSEGAGQLDAKWQPGVDDSVHALATGSDGSVYVGGYFSSVGGQPRSGIAKLSATGLGLVDPAWNPAPDSSVRALAVDASGAVYAGGFFKQIGGSARNYFAKLDGDGSGSADPDWNFSANKPVRALAIGSNDDVLVGGDFSMLADNTRLGVASISSDGSIKSPLDVELPGSVLALLPAPGGGVFAGGWFDKAGGLPRHNLLRIGADGNLDAHWAPTTDYEVNALAYDPNGSVYAGGYFSFVNGQPRGRLAKVSAGGVGMLDPGWSANGDDGVFALAVDANGSVFAGGFFTTISGQWRSHLAKLSGESGALDASWNPSPNNFVYALAVDGDSIFVGGTFSTGYSPLSIGGQPREGIAKLSLTGTGAADPFWDPAVGSVEVLALDPQGSLFAGRRSSRPAKLSRTGSGTIDSGWMPYVYSATGTSISGLALDRSGSLYIGGHFMAVGIDHPLRLARVSTQGAGVADPGWEPMPERAEIAGVSQGYGNYPLAVDNRGTLFVGGGFTTIGGQRRVGLAAFPDIILADGFEVP